MKRRITPYTQLFHFLASPRGEKLLSTEQKMLHPFWDYALGENLVILGGHRQIRLAQEAQHKNTLLIAPLHSSAQKNIYVVQAQYEALPLKADSIDTMLLPHTLEFHDDPYQILREAETALKPEGYLLIIGFNPLSILGLRQWFSMRRKAPWSGTFRRAARIKDWVRLLGFEIIEQRQGFYSLPISNGAIKSKLGFLLKLIQYSFPFLSGLYVIAAKKKRFCMTPLKSKWKEKVAEALHGGIAEPVRQEEYPHE